MSPPPLLNLKDENEYLKYFKDCYCREKIITYDNIRVRFNIQNFYHSFYESKSRNDSKSSFSVERAKRIDWIYKALKISNAEHYEGWDSKNKKVLPLRRVSIVWGNYIVIIELKKSKSFKEANFITAFKAEKKTLQKIRNSPKLKMPLVL